MLSFYSTLHPTLPPIRNHGGSGLRLGCVRGLVCLKGERASPRKHPQSRALEEQHLWNDQTGTKEISGNTRNALIFHRHPQPELASSRTLA